MKINHYIIFFLFVVSCNPISSIESILASDTTTSTSTSTTSTTIHQLVINNIKDAQEVLKKLYIYQGEIDGILGTATKSSIREFQNRTGLSVDGILGPNTKSALSKGVNSYLSSFYKDLIESNFYEFSQQTKDIQIKLRELNLYNGDLDGIYAFQTEQAIRQFQQNAGLNIDGIVGPKTLDALEKGEDSYVTINVTNGKNDISANVDNTTTKVTSSTNLTVDLKYYN